MFSATNIYVAFKILDNEHSHVCTSNTGVQYPTFKKQHRHSLYKHNVNVQYQTNFTVMIIIGVNIMCVQVLTFSIGKKKNFSLYARAIKPDKSFG